MKSILLTLSLFACTFRLWSQCEVISTVFQNNATCAGDPLTFMGYAAANCPGVVSYNYTWEASDSEGVLSGLTQSGNVISGTLIPVFILDYMANTDVQMICLTSTILDSNGDPLASHQTCFTNFVLPAPIFVSLSLSQNQCGSVCLANVVANGGTGPYVYQLSTGTIFSPNSWNCFEEAGTYDITAIDDNGCTGIASFDVAPSQALNNDCTNAVELQSGVLELDTLCSLELNNPSCSGFEYYQYGWFVINSGTSTHINIGVQNSYYGVSFNYPTNYNIEVYVDETGLDCTQAELVYCHDTSNVQNCFDLADHLTILPNTNYYIRAVVQWTSTMPMAILAVLSDDIIDPICGCTDVNSCNYDPGTMINDYSCGYSGCMDIGACNYMSYATCDNGSCYFGNDLNGHIYHDVNGDGIWQQGTFGEPGLGAGILTIEELGINVYPDASGSFVIPNLVPGTYTVSYNDPTGAWITSGSNPIQLTLPTCNGLVLGLIPSNEAMAQISGQGWTWSPNIHCANGFNTGIWIYNNGNVPLNGSFSMSFNPVLIASYLSSATPFDTYVDGVVTWNITNQAPGTYAYYQCHIAGPGAAYAGQYFTFQLDLVLNDDEGNLFYSNNWSTEHLVTCSYDPNDKQAVPEGYADQHFILADDEIEYRIRFQNTGNAWAQNVMIEDALDVAHLDLSTFYPVVASHSYSTIVHNDGNIQFVFDNILLPDSGYDEPGSQGYVVYRIKPLAGIEVGAVINNTAHIFFDDNPAVITNTTFHTIYDCALIQDLPIEEEECAGLTFTLDMYDPYVESYDWYLNGELISTQAEFIYSSETPGDLEITLVRSNPLCSVEHSMILQNHPLPGIDVVENGWVLSAPDGSSWQWYLNGDLIDGALNQTYTATEEGLYTVNTVNEFGCMSTSEDVFLTGVNELKGSVLSVYPNPMEKESFISLKSGLYSVTLYNVVGDIVATWNNVKNSLRIERAMLNAGTYLIHAINENGETESVKLIVK